MPPDVRALYVQLREAHTRDGWHTGGPLVALRHHATLQERLSACARRPCALAWMTPLSDSMANGFSDVYGCCLSLPARVLDATDPSHPSHPSHP